MRDRLIRIIGVIVRIGEDPGDPAEIQLAKRVHMVGFVVAIIVCLFVGLLYLAFDEPFAGANYLGFCPLALLIIWRYSRHHDTRTFTRTMGILVLLSNLLTVLALGDFIHSGAAVLWGLCYPLVGYMMFYGTRAALRWTIPFLVNLGICIFAGQDIRPDINMPRLVNDLILYTNLLTIGGIVMLAVGYFVGQRDQAYRLLRGEQEKAENLLLNILPKDIATILKNDQRTIAQHFDGASVMFADIVNFTPLSASLGAVDLVELLNEVFSYFDELVEQYQLEKIKTIGDCYMVAAGVPRPRSDHARVLTDMALDIHHFTSSRQFKGHQIAFRIGINSGPIVAGVIGRKKFIYDLWGDAVNTASRMESHGSSGVVQITRSTYEQIRDEFQCEPKGTIYVKGKGEMEIWHVIGRSAVA